MIDALVKFGVKDQNVVLSTMDKITKKKKEIAKKTEVSFFAKEKFGQRYGAGAAAAKFGLGAGARALTSQLLDVGKDRRTEEQKKIDDYKKEQFENSKLIKGAKMAGEALTNVARGAATLDPVAFIQSTLSAAGKAATSIPFLGGAAQGTLELAGISVGAAGGAIGSAKQSTAGALEIQKRNAQNNLYGNELSFGAAEKAAKEKIAQENAKKIAQAEAFDAKQNLGALKRVTGGAKSNTAGELRSSLLAQSAQTDTSNKSTGWTPADKTQFINSVSGAFGKIQKPLADTLNNLIEKGKNVEQFTQVASGNFAALGTDEGAILQQISNGFASALPSVRQDLQNELLKAYGHQIADESKDLAARRATAGAWAKQEEYQVNRIADAAADMGDILYKLNAKLNTVQIRLIEGAEKLAAAVNKAVDIIS